MAETKVKIITPHEGGQEMFVRSNVDIAIFGGCLAGGKEHPVNEPVMTPNGWRKIGDLKVGDLVNTPFQKPVPISAVYPQGVKDIYRLITSDGRTSECGLEHLWEVRTKKQVFKYRRHREHKNFFVMTTREIIERMGCGEKLFIQIPDAQEFEAKDLPIDPYLLGVLIGDGCLTDPNLTKRNGIPISSNEPDIIKKCADIVGEADIREHKGTYTKYIYSSASKSILQKVKDLGLATYSYNKFIPQEYLFGSIEQRRRLLAGLFDTDGSVEDKNRLSYSTTSSRLKDDFVHLCRSLGYIVKVKTDNRSHKYTSGIAYDISICTFDRIFSSKKHTERYERNMRNCKWQYHRTENHVRITSVEYVRQDEAVCIYLDYPDHLYIANDFLTTHNTFGAILANAEPFTDPNYRAVFFRRTLGELKTAGGVVDEFEHAYGDAVSITKSENPRVVYKNTGAWIECRQIADENPNKVRETFKGSQWDAAFFEELTGFQFYTFNYLASRVRGKSWWSGKVRATTNPSKHHWVRKMLAWYIDDATGLVDPEKSGVVRYVYLDGKTVDDYVWGDSKEEVYRKCKVSIDKKIARLNDDSITYENFIKSFTFILGNIAENKALLEKNPDYVGNVSGDEGDALLMGSWNYDPDEDNESLINQKMARSVNVNEPQVNGSRWICVDLADTGSNTTCIGVFDGLHWFDIDVLGKSTPKENAHRVLRMARKHDIPDSHIIYDAQRAAYMLDYIPNAVPYYSFGNARGLYKREYKRRKDENFARLVEAINRGEFSIAPEVADLIYEQNKMGTLTFMQKFTAECNVVQWAEDNTTGKKRLLSKKEMISRLGRGESTDILDTAQMLMSVYESYEFGLELDMGRKEASGEEVDDTEFDIFDDSNWA